MRNHRSPSTLANSQALRAFAALSVICVHILEQSAKYDHGLDRLAVFRNWGDCGVDLFFVISGFIMVYIQRHKPAPPWTFLIHRAYRVVPLYWALTLTYAALWLVAPDLFRHAVIDSERFLQSLSFSTMYDDSHPVLYLGWTLEYEMAFYVVFGICLFATSLCTGIWLCAAALTFLWLLTSMDAILFEFLFGAILGLIYDRPWIRENAVMLLVVGVLCFGFTVADPAHAFEHRWLYWGLPAALIVAGAVNLPQIRAGSLTYLGDASYSIYLIQILTISAYYKAATALPFDIPNDFHAMSGAVLTVLAGVICYEMLERPIVRARGRIAAPLRHLKRRPEPTAARNQPFGVQWDRTNVDSFR